MAESPLRRSVFPLLLALSATTVTAQSADSLRTVRASDAIARIKRFTSSDVASARLLADSLVNGLPNDASAMPDALFARASIAASAAEAERDYSRIVNEFRFAARVPDALMRLALLESARNNRIGALRHLDRLLRDHGDSPVRSRASLLAGRLRMDSGDPARGCELLAAAHASAGLTERDVRDQAERIGASCPTPVATMAQRDPPPMGVARAERESVGVAAAAMTAPTAGSRQRQRDSVAAARAAVAAARRDSVERTTAARRDSVARTVAARRDSAARAVAMARRDSVPTRASAPATTTPVARRDSVVAPATPKPVPAVPRRDTVIAAAPVAQPAASVAPPAAPTAPTGQFAVQFAAYNDRPGAEQFARVLQGRGIAARVEGTAAPFRVRAGRFSTRADAEASAAVWRSPGQPAIVVASGRTP